MSLYQKKLLCIILIFFLFLCVHEESFSQKFKSRAKINTHRQATSTNKIPFGRKAYTSFGISLHALNYFGDLSPSPKRLSTDIDFTRPGFGLSYIRRSGPRFTVKGEFIYGVIRGEDNSSADPDDLANGIYRYRRNLSFRNHLKEFSITLLLDLFENSGFYHYRYKIAPYVFGGLAVFHHSPQGKAPATDLNGDLLPEAGQWINLKPLGTEGQGAELNSTDANFGIKPYKSIQPSIPAGIGIRVRISNATDMWIELGFRYLFTDYIDDVSRNYVDLGVLKSDLAKAMSYRTNELGPEQGTISYRGRDGKTYTVVPGYGSEQKTYIRGNSKDNDFILITTMRFSHILKATIHKPKSR